MTCLKKQKSWQLNDFTEMIDNKEKVVRVLFPNKVLHGRVIGGAFVLRPQREETNISVFRVNGPTFANDIQKLDAGRNLCCSLMGVEEIRSVIISQGMNTISCDVIETGLLQSTSHAGIIVSVNGQQLIGGHESEMAIDNEAGGSMDALLLAMQHRLAAIAQKGLAHVNDFL